MLTKIIKSPWTAIITLALILCIRVADPAFVESVRLRYFDTLITSKAPTENNIYTVDIDESALEKYGQYPFPRNIYARIIEDLYRHNAGLVVFNIPMPEHDRFGQDLALANTLSKYPVILSNIPAERNKNKPRAPGSAVIGAEYSDLIVQYPGMIANVPLLEKSAAGIGIVNTLPEVDGVNRRIPLVVTVDGKIYPALSMETLRVATGQSTVQIKLNELGIEKMRIPGPVGIVETDGLGRIWIDWSQKSSKTSVTKLPDFKGAIVVVGVTAAGIANPVPTALGAVWPHEIQAATMSTLINQVVIQRPAWADGAELLLLSALGVAIIFLSRWTYVGLTFTGVVLCAIIPVTRYMFSEFSALGDATALLGGLVLVALHCYGVKFLSEFLQKQQIKKQFGTYLSPAMVERLQKNPELLALGGESRELSIMFTDVRGFTTISEHYGKDVQGLTQIMNRYMTAMTRRIIENNGTLDKYIGDAQMAFWNAPLDDAEHAKNAVRTGLAMLGDLDEFNREISRDGVPPFGMGLGINTDIVVVGNMGSDQRFDYTCLGDGVNLASRLEGQSKPYGVKVVLGPKTAEYVQDEFSVVELDCIAVKGKTEGVKIYTVAQTDGIHHQAFLDEYYAGEWEEAIVQCKKLIAQNNELVYYYENMLDRLEDGKPDNWDGTYRATSK